MATYQRWSETVRDNQGNAVNGASCSVYSAGTGTLADIYNASSDDTSPSPMSNPYVTTATGEFSFMANDGLYDIRIDGGGFASKHRRVRLVSGGDRVLYVDDYGATGDGLTDDTNAINLALSSASPGSVVKLTNKSYKYTQIVIANNKTTLQLSPGTVLINDNAAQTAPVGPVAFHPEWCSILVQGDECVIDGARSGSVVGPSVWDGTNTYVGYATILVTGKKCRVQNLVLSNVQRCGVWFKDTEDATFIGNTIEGNYPSASYTGTQTANFGVFYDVGTGTHHGNFRAVDNTFRTTVQGIFGGNTGSGVDTTTGGVLISDNNFESCWNHGIYCATGVGVLIDSNSFSRCGLPIVCMNERAVVSNNTLYTDTTGGNQDLVGISMRDPRACVVAGNTIKGDASASSVVIDFTNLLASPSEVSDNVCSNNTIEIQNGAACIGIRMGSSNTATLKNNIISENVIKIPGQQFLGAITVTCKSGSTGYGNVVRGNIVTLTALSYGIYLNAQDYAVIEGNTVNWEADLVSGTTSGGIVFQSTTKSRVSDNHVICTASWGTNTTLRAIWETTSSNYNLIDNNITSLDPTKLTLGTPFFKTGANTNVRGNAWGGLTPALTGTATVALGTASIVVANTNVQSSSVVLITPADSGGGKLMAAPGVYVTQTAGTGFSILTADGTNAAQASAFRWEIR